MARFDTLHFVASGRLGLWDTLPDASADVVDRLETLLQYFGGVAVEADGEELYQYRDASVASLGSILDKIVSRGHPTLVDLDLEYDLAAQQSQVQWVRSEEETGGRLVGTSFKQSSVQTTAIQKAAAWLLASGREETATLQAEQREDWEGEGISGEEDQLYRAFGEAFGLLIQSRLRRQVALYELLGRESDEFQGQKVDFVLDYGPIQWVIEVDGEQHEETGQQGLDERRDEALREAGWNVARVSATTARTQAREWWTSTWQARLSSKAEEWVKGQNEWDQDAVEAAQTLVVYPHLVQQAARAWVQLLLYNVFPVASDGPVTILLLEEDFPGGVEGLQYMLRLWRQVAVLSADISAPPEVHIDRMGADALTDALDEGIRVRSVEAPGASYDLIVSRAAALYVGEQGPLERQQAATVSGRRVRMRRTSRRVDSRTLQWAERLTYDLEDLETALRLQDEDDAPPVPQEKYEALQFFLQQVFRKHDFWDGQARVVSRLLRGEPAVVLLPTGGGKSLTYQFSGLLLPGVTLVVDPLIALMEDQVDNMKSQGIDRVGQISSTLDRDEKQDELEAFGRGERHVLFVSPERLQIPRFRTTLQQLVAEVPISLAVIDEVHCVSEWGHDFRPSYLHMGRNIKRYCALPGATPPTLVGLTGTASFAVLTDVQMEMGIAEEEAIILPQSFDRKELTFHVEQTTADAREASLLSLHRRIPRDVGANPQTFFQPRGDQTNGGIVFCPHVNGSLGVVEIASKLGHGHYYCGSKPKYYKGRDWNTEKLDVQRQFKRNKIQELVATKSFGMGIDKPNIRYTIHYGIPQSVEGFYQEAGRAGRNGKEEWARCYVVYADDNWSVAEQILTEEDHRKATQLLDKVNWRDRGDILHQLWFLFNTYADRSEEKASVLKFWDEFLANEVGEMTLGATNTIEVPHGSWKHRTPREKAIFRLVMLGLVEEYAIDWNKRIFAVQLKKVAPTDVVNRLRTYLKKYKFDEYADAIAQTISTAGLEAALRDSVNHMVDFVYDEIVAKRKQALRTMAELCRNFRGDEPFREAILAYLQESEFTEVLRAWVNKPFAEVGVEAVQAVLEQLESLEQVKRLVGTTRRMLDEDPSNIALRMVSVSARLRSEAEGETSVLQEFDTLLRALAKVKTDHAMRRVVVEVLQDTGESRPQLFDVCLNRALRSVGSASLVQELHHAFDFAEVNEENQWALTVLTAADALQVAQTVDILSELSNRCSPVHA